MTSVKRTTVKLIAAIVVIIVAVAFLWFTQEPAGHVIEIADLPANARGHTEPDTPPTDLDTSPNDVKIPADTPTEGLSEETEPEEIEVELRGRVVPSGWPAGSDELLLELALSVRVIIVLPGREPADALVEYIDVEDWSFSTKLGASDFDLVEEEFARKHERLLREAGWHIVLFDEIDEDAPDLDSLEPGQTLPGLIKPRVEGRTVTFPDQPFTPESDLEGFSIMIGSIVHESGTALKHSQGLTLVWENSDEFMFDGEEEFDCDANGTFALIAFDSGLREGATNWQLYATSDSDSYPSLGGVKQLDAPKRNGNVLDFGRITVGGALVLINIAENLDEEEEVEIDFDSDTLSHRSHLRPGKPAAAIWLHAGRHSWSATVDSSRRVLGQHRGTLMLSAGDSQTLDFDFQPYETTSVVVEAVEGKLASAWVSWELRQDGERVAKGQAARGVQHFLVPIEQGLVTHVRAGATGYKRATGKTKPGNETLILVLQKIVPKKRPDPTILKIRLAGYDSALEEEDCRIALSQGEDYRVATSTLKILSNMGEALRVAAGEWTLELRGGAKWGYPGGVFCGPIKATAIAETTVEVVLPHVPVPPWPKPVRDFVADVTVHGQGVDVTAPTLDGVHAEPVIHKMKHEMVFKGTPPIALLDGKERVPVTLEPPAQPGDEAFLRLVLEPRIEVRAKRNGKAIPEFKVVATGSDCRCDSWGDEGQAVAWLPPGDSMVYVYLDNNLIHLSEIEVKRGKVLVIDVSHDSVRVEFEHADPPTGMGQGPPGWELLRFDEHGEWIAEENSPYGVELLQPGRYRVQPFLLNQHKPIDFDITDGQDRVIRVPKLPKIEYGDCLLHMDTSVLGDKEVYANVSYIWAGIRTEQRLGNNHRPWYWSITASVVPEGIRIEKLPLGQDVILTAYLEVDEGQVERIVLMKPIKVRFDKPGQSVATDWKNGTLLHEDWDEFDACTVSFTPGFSAPFSEDGYAFPGRQEVVFYDQHDEIVLRDWVIVPESVDEFAIPPALRAKLVEAGLLSE